MNPEEFIAAKRFNKLYITSSEIVKRLNVNRPAIHFRRKAGLLPNAIVVSENQLVIWERDFIEPYIQQWKQQLNARRTSST